MVNLANLTNLVTGIDIPSSNIKTETIYETKEEELIDGLKKVTLLISILWSSGKGQARTGKDGP